MQSSEYNLEDKKLKKILSQPELCDGCRDCEEACEKLYGAPRIMIREINGTYYPIICQQCEDAPCKAICPTEAINETIDPERCIGCGLCMIVCPFGAIVLSERKAQKCNQCPKIDTPACIKACSKRALSIVDAEKLKLEKQEKHIAKMAGTAKPKLDIINLVSKTKKAEEKLK